jgi:hypothetical protein
MAIGTIAKDVNAQKLQVYVSTPAGNWALLQSCRMTISHPIFREATTDGGVDLFTGSPDVNLSGSLLFSVDEWTDANGFAANLVKSTSTGEVPDQVWGLKFFAKDSGFLELSAPGGKLSVVDISKASAEGAVKVDISVALPVIPTGVTV